MSEQNEPATGAAAAPDPAPTFAMRTGFGILLGAAALLFVASLRPVDGGVSVEAEREVPIPRVLEPIGDIDVPPTRFRWKRSSDAADLAQVVVYRGDGSRIWATAPTREETAEIPEDAYVGITAGEKCYWRVREVADGQVLAASGLTRFVFRRDLEGNEAPPHLLGLPLPPGTPAPLFENMGPDPGPAAP